MPCTVTRQEAEYYEREANKKKFGVDDLDERITEAVACELARAFEKASLNLSSKPRLSKMTRKWIELHKESDKQRKRGK
jgi:hypothetical protein